MIYSFLTNKQNNRMWLEEGPLDWIEKLHDEKVVGIPAEKSMDHTFFKKPVNRHNYLEMLKNSFWSKHYQVESHKKYYFQQGGATPQTVNLVQDWCVSKFGANFINKQQWPPRSPDFNPCDYFLWGYLKSKVYKPLPKTLDDLRREVRKINTSTLESTFLNFSERCQLVVEKNGGHFENK